MKTIKKVIQLREILPLVLITAGGFLGGNVLHDVIMNLVEQGENPTTFPLGTLLGTIAMIAMVFLGSFVVLAPHFDMAISMGATRKSFFANELINRFVSVAASILILILGNRLEVWKLGAFYPQYPVETDVSFLFSIKMLIPGIALALGLNFLMGAVFLRFQNKALFVYAVSYVIMMLLISQIGSAIEPMIAFFEFSTLPWGVILPVALTVTGMGLLWGAWGIIHRQDVRI